MTKQPKRAHKSKAERKRLAKTSRVKIVGEGGFIQRAAKPGITGDKKLSRLVRVDSRFAAWLTRQAKIHGSVTNVTRRLHAKRDELADMIEPKQGEIET